MAHTLPCRTRTYRHHHLDSTRWDAVRHRPGLKGTAQYPRRSNGRPGGPCAGDGRERTGRRALPPAGAVGVGVGRRRRDNDPAALGPLPGNARVERYIPQSRLFPLCSAVISHGGTGTTLAALVHGLPQLLIPQGADQFVNAQRCVHAGLGLRLLPGEVTAAAVRERVADLLGDDSGARRRAGLVAEEMAATSAPAAWVEPLRQLARRASGESRRGDPGGGVGE